MAGAPPFSKRLPKINHYASDVVKRCEEVLNEHGHPRLLQQQIEALRTVTSCSLSDRIALVSMPTGSGKTGVIACLPYYLGDLEIETPIGPRYPFDKPMLVIAPNLAIPKQLIQELTVIDINTKKPFLIRADIKLFRKIGMMKSFQTH